MKRFYTINTVFNTLGYLLIIQGLLLLFPLIVLLVFKEYNMFSAFLIPAGLSFVIGYLFKLLFKSHQVHFVQSLLVCGLSWIVLSVFSCLPFVIGANTAFLDAYFETVSGFTTTGITIYTNIESLSKTIIFWRSLIQWIGGLGILTFFLAITFKSNNAYFNLFSAESHKIDSARPTPSVIKTVIILWTIYTTFTVAEIIILKILGTSLYDAICHSMTTLSTGGFSPYDASIDHYRQAGFKHYRLIEYTMTFFMFLGGMNFLLHYKLFIGRFRDVFKNLELKTYLFFIFVVVALILINHHVKYEEINFNNFEEKFRSTIFTVISIITTTGFGTVDINKPFFPAMAKQLLLILMLVGGCVGSTGGGIKVLRIAVLYKLFKNQIKRLYLPRKALSEVVIDQKIFPNSEIKRITGLFLGWLFLILVGGAITAFLTDLDSWQSFSGMFSALGNIGPCYFSVEQMSNIHPIVKIIYIFGMLAGRLEILPILLLFRCKIWIH